MKQLFTKTPLVVIAFLLSIVSCQHDDTTGKDEQPESQIKKLDVIGHVVKGDSIRQINKDLNLFLSDRFEERNRFSSEDIASNAYGFTVNTGRVFQLNGETYTNYIFNVTRDNPISGGFENYMLTVFNDGRYMQVLIYYPLIDSEDGAVADISSATVTYINDATLLTGVESSPCANTSEEIIEWNDEADCIYFNCTAGGNHSYGQSCSGSPGEQPFKICYGGWVVTGCTNDGGSSSGSSSTNPTDPFPPTGNGGNPTNPVDPNNPNEEVPTVPFIPAWQEVADCMNGGILGSLDNSGLLSPEDIDWLQDRATGGQYASAISNYINEKGCENSKEFIEEAVEALQNEDEVDFVNEVIFKIEQDCAKDIAKKIVNNSSSLSQSILFYFNQDKNYIIKYSNENLPSGYVGATSILPTCTDGKCTFEIKLNNDMLNGATDLVIAKVILHETIHATLNYLFHSGQFINQGLDPNSANDPNYKQLVEAFTHILAVENPDSLIGNIDDLEHQYMTIFVDDMINTLKTVGLDIGYQQSSTQLSDTYLRDLVWSGSLESTDAIGEIFTFAEQERIHYRGLAELTNASITYQIYDENGIPNSITIQPQSNVINNSNSPCFPN